MTTPEPATRTRVALVFGGRSSEHTISCATAAAVLEAIDRDTYEVLPIGIRLDGEWVLVEDDPEPLRLAPGYEPKVPDGGVRVVPPLRSGGSFMALEEGQPPRDLGTIDVVFPLLHGPFGEDGTIQGLLEMAGVRYVGCGVLSSAVMMDKHHMKVAFADAGLPIGPYVVATDRQWRSDPAAVLDAAASLQYPLFVKPARAGSSMGVSRVDEGDDLRAAIEAAREHDPKVLIEQGLVGREVECGVLQGRDGQAPRVSKVGEVTFGSDHEFYDYEAKYFDEDNLHIECPAALPDAVSEELRRMAVVGFEACECEGLARFDCFYTPDGRLYVNEINTMPGFTPFSMYPFVWSRSGVSYPELVDELLQLALARPVGLR